VSMGIVHTSAKEALNALAARLPTKLVRSVMAKTEAQPGGGGAGAAASERDCKVGRLIEENQSEFSTRLAVLGWKRGLVRLKRSLKCVLSIYISSTTSAFPNCRGAEPRSLPVVPLP